MNQIKDKYRRLFEKMPDAFAYHQVIYDQEGNLVDYQFLEINDAFEQLTGLKREAVIGKKVTEVHPEISDSAFDWIGVYGKVSSQGESIRFEQYFEPADRWYDVNAFSDEPGFFAVSFREVTTQKNENKAFAELIDRAQEIMHFPAGELNYQVIADGLLELSEAKFAAINLYDQGRLKSVTKALSGISNVVRKVSGLLGFELVGKEWDIMPERVNAIQEGHLLHFKNLHDSASGAISVTTSSMLERLGGTGSVYVVEMRFEDDTLGDMIMFMPRHKTLVNPQIIEIYGALVASALIRFRADEELINLKTFNESIVQNINEGIVIYNNSGEATFTNPTMLQMLGYKADESIGTHWTLLVPPQYHQFVEEANARRSAGESDRYELEVKHKNGSLIPVQISGSPYHDSRTGEVVGTLAVLTNLTDRVKSEEMLRESEHRYRDILESMAEGFYEVDLKGKILACNRAAANLLGYQEEELVGMSYKSLCKDYDPVYREFNQAFKNGKSKFSVIMEMICKDGSIVTADLSISLTYDKQGNVIGFRGLGRDITERRRAEETLRESEMRSKALVKAIPDLLFRFNREGVYLEAVVKEEEMLHTKTRELFRQNLLIGKTMFETLPASIAHKLLAGIKTALDSGEVQFLEYSYEAKGSEHYLEARLAPIGTTEVVSIVRDITESKSHEAEMQYISFHDQLTGLYNRRYFENELQRLDGAREHPVVVISADLDGLKLINDTLGHAEGDLYLQAGAELLKSALRASDILARVGGDEFALILPRTTRDAGKDLVSRIRRQVDRYNQERTGAPLSISIGLAVSESNKQPLEETYKKADNAMYKDKLKRGQLARAGIVSSLIDKLNERADLGEGNSTQVQDLCDRMGRTLKLDESQINSLRQLSQVYDLGKVNMPDQLVHSKLKQKTNELTEAEREAIRRHPEIGYRIAASSPELVGIADLILRHHENFDGSGYPLGIDGEEVPIECRILAIAIAYSAMINPRPYAKKLKPDEALAELKRCAGTQFDPRLVKEFLALFESDPK